MSLIHREVLKEAPYNPHRTGRHVVHDERSFSYAYFAIPYGALKSVRWDRRIPVLDQGSIGSCTANAATGWLGTDNAKRRGLQEVAGLSLDEQYALGFYHDETVADSIGGVYPP